MADYLPPIDTLLTLGPFDLEHVPDYVAMGLGPEHQPDLIRLARAELSEGDSNDPRSWAPLHAWWALGQVGGEAAIEPLLELMHVMEEQDAEWLEDLPRIVARIGPPAIEPIARVLADENELEYVRIGCIEALEIISNEHPETRDRCVEIVTRQLAMNDPRVPNINGFLVSALITLKATESASTIEEAFQADCVDESITGDWSYVRYDLGLGPKPPHHRWVSSPFAGLVDPEYRKSRPDPKKLLKRKAQKEARKQQQARSKRRKRK
jgi:hypothetical protein